MSTERIRSAIEAASAYLSDHPEEARYTDSAAIATVESGLRVRVSGPGGETITTDMPASVGGDGSDPSPGWLLRAAQASCVATLITMRAAHLGITLESLEVTVDSESDDRGILGLDDQTPAGPLSGRIAVSLAAAGVEGARLDAIARWGIEHCPVVDALVRPVPIVIEVRTG